jgi:hypothetical protein
MTKARDIASAAPAPAGVTSTELGYVDGVTSALQTQIDSKIGSAAAINPTIVDAKGDIIAATAADTVARLAVGANNTVLTADSSTATGLKWAAAAGGGKVLQVVSATKTDTFTSTSTAYTDITGLSVTITPSSTSSKIMIFADVKGNGTPASNGAIFCLARGGTAIAIGDAASTRTRGNGGLYINDSGQTTTTTMSFLDSPATTSATTYNVRGLIAGSTFYVNRASGDPDTGAVMRAASTITVMEIGA